jgi:hypothetical protein
MTAIACAVLDARDVIDTDLLDDPAATTPGFLDGYARR